jgi:PTH1 family peptidyl-tRNA hydrolase
MVGLEAVKTLVVVFLGNPGKEYEMTRHNMGFLVGEAFLKELKTNERFESRFEALVAKVQKGQVVYHTIRPLTYMNLSGRALRKYLDYYKLSVSSVLVVCDDVDLPFGKLRLRGTGSPGGHNGLKSIENHLETKAYYRLRIGVGRGEAKELSDHVLGSFSEEERASLDQVFERAIFVIENISEKSIAALMSHVEEGKNFGRNV